MIYVDNGKEILEIDRLNKSRSKRYIGASLVRHRHGQYQSARILRAYKNYLEIEEAGGFKRLVPYAKIKSANIIL